MPGPVPKRSDQRRRRNKDSQVEKIALSTLGSGPVEPPELGFPAHPIAEEWYHSLAESGQARFFEPSDWQAARFVAQAMTRLLNAGKLSAQLYQAVWTSMNDLLTTEASRRRVRLEIERAAEEQETAADVINLFVAATGQE